MIKMTCPGVQVCIRSLRELPVLLLLQTPGQTLQDLQDSDPSGGFEEQTEVQQRLTGCLCLFRQTWTL